MFTSISAQELEDRRRAGESIELIDVRTPVEFRELHVAFARNIPLDRLDMSEIQRLRELQPGRPLFVICRSGNRSRKACEALLQGGVSSAVSVEGGTLACDAAGLPMVRGRKAISLERQVRIAAGMLVLAGSILGYFAHPAWIALAAFVGGGLVVAGVTDACGMAMILARMPWNQVSDCSGGEPRCS